MADPKNPGGKHPRPAPPGERSTSDVLGPEVNVKGDPHAEVRLEAITDRARSWCRSQPTMTGKDMAAALDINVEDCLQVISGLEQEGAIRAMVSGSSGDPLAARYQVRLTSSDESGQPWGVDPKQGKSKVYDRIAQAMKPKSPQPGNRKQELDGQLPTTAAFHAVRAFVHMGESMRGYRAELRFELQHELDELGDHLEANDGHLGSLEANKDFAAALNSLLDDLGLRLVEPKSGMPATLRVLKPTKGPETGYFAFNLGRSSKGSYARLPRLVVIDRPEYGQRSDDPA